MYALFERKAVQQVGVEKQRPAGYRHPLAVVLLAAHLSRRHAKQRARLVIIPSAPVVEVHVGVVAQKQTVNAVIAKAMPYGRNLGIVDNTYKRVLLSAAQVAGIVVHVPYLQYVAHSCVYIPYLHKDKSFCGNIGDEHSQNQ